MSGTRTRFLGCLPVQLSVGGKEVCPDGRLRVRGLLGTAAEGATDEAAARGMGPFESSAALAEYVRSVSVFREFRGEHAEEAVVAMGVWRDGAHFAFEANCSTSGYDCESCVTFTFGPEAAIIKHVKRELKAVDDRGPWCVTINQ